VSLTKPDHISETEVVRLWQEQLRKHRLLEDSEGRPVEIIYPGRLNDGQGGDFRDAVVASGSSCKSGNIEIHTRASGWQSHGHHKNPAYNCVVLHVALKQDRPGEAVLQNGKTIPTVILEKCLAQGTHTSNSQLPCQGIINKSENVARYLDRIGQRRFFIKAAHYQTELAQIEAGQSLYQGVLTALGYTKNQGPFQELAQRVPLSSLEEIARAEGNQEDILSRLQYLLYSNATAISWELYRVRPDNSPARRIAALSHLIYRYREDGWLSAFLKIIRRAPAERVSQEMEPAFIVSSESGPDLLGRERAAEIIINVLLPFAWTWSRQASRFKLSRKIIKLYRSYPRLESNSIERHMLHQLSLQSRQVNTASRQQGLIHIYKTLCTHGKCGRCGFNYSKSPCSFSRY
jgi:hypothetical protein